MSCFQVIAKVTEFLRQQIDDKLTELACFIAIKKNFDVLDHEVSLEKLEDYGFRGEIHEILRNFLSDRKQ